MNRHDSFRFDSNSPGSNMHISIDTLKDSFGDSSEIHMQHASTPHLTPDNNFRNMKMLSTS